MNRQERRAQERILRANAGLAKACAEASVRTWAGLCGFTGEDAHLRMFEASVSADEWSQTAEVLETDAVLRVLAALRSSTSRSTEQERDHLILTTRLEAARIFREKLEAYRDYCGGLACASGHSHPATSPRGLIEPQTGRREK